MYRFADGVVAAERERDVAHASADVGQGEAALERPRRVYERDRVAVVFLDAGRHGEDVGVEDDVARREADSLGEDAV